MRPVPPGFAGGFLSPFCVRTSSPVWRVPLICSECEKSWAEEETA